MLRSDIHPVKSIEALEVAELMYQRGKQLWLDRNEQREQQTDGQSHHHASR
jgi:hypothetical protein